MMSFPIDYWFFGESKGIKHTLVGNAVPPKMSYAIAKAIAVAEQIPVPNHYPRIKHDEEIKFVDLNGSKFEVRKEKPRREVAKFKYHIPYLIIKAYRVELTNYHSDFENKEFIWNVEIHYSQGKAKAAVLTPQINESSFPENFSSKIESFIQEVTCCLPTTYNCFQQLYCLTEEERKKREKIGPYELLSSIREFLDDNIPKNQQWKDVEINNSMKLPYAILAGYYVMTKIINKMQ